MTTIMMALETEGETREEKSGKERRGEQGGESTEGDGLGRRAGET